MKLEYSTHVITDKIFYQESYVLLGIQYILIITICICLWASLDKHKSYLEFNQCIFENHEQLSFKF